MDTRINNPAQALTRAGWQGMQQGNVGEEAGEVRAEAPYMSYVPPAPPMAQMSPRSSMPRTFPSDSADMSDMQYTPGFLRSQIGKMMRVEFFMGNQTSDRTGRLLDVGASYIVLEGMDLYSSIMCDLYSIKFVTIIDAPMSGYLQMSP